jgi:drug/metabolite transporter (DMT)-like permease
MGSVLTNTQPLLVFALAVLFLNEETSKIPLAATILGFFGVSTLFLESGSSFALSIPAAVLVFGAFFCAASLVYYKRFLSCIDPFLLSVLQTAIGLPFMAGLSLALERPEISFSASYISIILYARVGASAVGSTLWLILLRDEDATALAGPSLIVSIIALGFGWRLMSETLDVRSAMGTALVLNGVYLVNRKVTESSRAER